MIALFKQKSPANIVLLLIFGLLIKMPFLLHPPPVQATAADGPLYQALLATMGTGLGTSLLAFALLYGQALMVNYLVNEHRMTTRQTFLPAMAYLLTTSLLPEWNYLSAPLLASVLVILAFIKLFRLYNAPAAKGAVFNIGLIMGISSFLFFPSAAFLICLLLGLVILRPFRVNELLLLLVGALTPYYFYSLYLFLTDRFALSLLFPSFSLQVPRLRNTLGLALAVLLLTVPFMMGAYHVQLQLRRMLIQVRKNWSILLLYLLLALLVPFINSNSALHNWVLAVPPFAAFHAAAYLYPKKNWMTLLLFLVTLAFVLYQQYGPVPLG